MGKVFYVASSLAALAASAHAAVTTRSSVRFNGPFEVEASGISNIHITYDAPVNGHLSIHYGSCDGQSSSERTHHVVGNTYVGSHSLAKRHSDWSDQRPTKFVWMSPEDIPHDGCLHAFVDGVPVGKSRPYSVKRKTRRSKRATFADVADPTGPWFDGVAYLKQKEPDETFVASVKSKKFGILGGGMSGLMTACLLESVGIHDWEILEASNRIGGRVHTSYLNNTTPDQYQYQEMGPMRFPVSVTDPDSNETIEIQDHKMVFQLAATLNALNGNDSSLAVNFIKWIQSSPNVPSSTSKRRPDGTVPSISEVSANPLYADNVTATYSNATAVAEASAAYEDWLDIDSAKIKELASNVFQGHKKALSEGHLDFSEAQFVRNVLQKDWNITDQIDSITDISPSWEYDAVYFMASDWRTIDKGLSRLPQAFGPLVLNRTKFHTQVSELKYDATKKKVVVGWRTNDPFAAKAKTASYDYVTVAVPFSRVRLWRLPSFSNLLSRAISRVNYSQACKVALHYKTRFWEHLQRPINGGCGSTNIAGIGSVCYPSYKINSTGPGVLLASYSSGQIARSLGSLKEIDHVGYTQRAMVEIHGKVAAEQFTGNYDRICWENNEFQSGAWADPTVGQHELYIPAYYRTEFNTVFVGEHTSYTHAWIFSALESAVRGSAQLLLDLGLVDEAKQVTEQWMARWIEV